MIDVNAVLKSYTGKIGCMCGCRGVYRVASKHLEAANAARGYDYDPEDVSDRSVKMAVNKLNKLIDWNDAKMVEQHVTTEYAYYDNDQTGRTVCVYFVK
jgi:acetolactate synthase regulatory subunit